jgi:hypothetical protein
MGRFDLWMIEHWNGDGRCCTDKKHEKTNHSCQTHPFVYPLLLLSNPPDCRCNAVLMSTVRHYEGNVGLYDDIIVQQQDRFAKSVLHMCSSNDFTLPAIPLILLPIILLRGWWWE